MTRVLWRMTGAPLFGLVLALLLAGCVTLPTTGSVQTRPGPDQGEQDEPFDYRPDRPVAGAGPLDVVAGFLLAMQAWPLSTAVATEFLTTEATNTWVPARRTVVYGTESALATGGAVSLSLTDTVQLDGRGTWLGSARPGRAMEYPLKVVKERGEWRISNPPNALLVPRSHFDTRYRQYLLYFFDKSAQVLVPEPVHLPRGEQTANLLVRGLLRGPDQDLLGATRTFLPARTQLDLPVLVSEDGTAELPLSDEVLALTGPPLEHALAQLAWTLRQVTGIETMQITVDGSPLDLPALGVELEVSAWPEYDPAVNWASQELFGIRRNRIVALVADAERPVAGVFGRSADVRSFAVDLPAERIAAVDATGSTVRVAPRNPDGGVKDADGSVVFSSGTDLLRPAWDIYGQVWLVDRTSRGAVVRVVRGGDIASLEAPGISGRDVSAFQLSRDGTRLVAVVQRRSRDHLLVARVMRTSTGQVARITEAVPLPLAAYDVDEIRDLAWRTPATVALLTGPTPGSSQVVIARVDGSSVLGDVATNTEIFSNGAVRILTSPAEGAPLLVGTRRGQLFELAPTGRWTGTSVAPGLRAPTFVG